MNDVLVPGCRCNWMPHLQPQLPHVTLQDGLIDARLEPAVCVHGLQTTVIVILRRGCAGVPSGNNPDRPVLQMETIRISC